jgi:LPS export ABC transporter protein LptC
MAIVTDTRPARGLRLAPSSATGAFDRARAFAIARRHSRVVRLLRHALPLAAALVLAGYALVLTVNWRMSAGRVSVSGISLTAEDFTMKDPTYSGTTKDGGNYVVRARRAVVTFDQKAPIKLIDVSGDLVQASNVKTKLKAKHGILDNPKQELELYDGVEIEASNGFMARLTRAKVYSKENKVVSDHPVSAMTPTGSVQAARMVMNTKTSLAQFRGEVAVQLVPSASQAGIAAGKDARQPISIHSEELDFDDAQKTAHFRGNVGAVQGDTMLNTPYLFAKYEGKAMSALGSDQQQPAASEPGGKGARVTLLWARNGVEVTIGDDRRVTSDIADFDVAADTALFVGNVNVTQNKNTLRGGRLFLDRKAGKSRLEPENADGRIAALFHQAAPAGAQPKAARTRPSAADALLGGSFKADPNAPMEIEANLLEIFDASKKAVFTGNVVAQQGDFLMRTVEMTAFYTGEGGLGSTAGDKKQGDLTRIEAKRKVIISSKDGRTAISEWANFDVKANTALLGGGVTVVRDKDVAEGQRLKIDLTTGMYRFELESGGEAAPATAPLLPSSPGKPEDRTCPPGKQCMLFYPKDVKEKAKELLKKGPVPQVR